MRGLRAAARRQGAAERGSVTAELAVTFPAVALLLALVLLGAGAGVLQLRLEESARAGARAMARGENAATAVGIATALAGAQASVSISVDGGTATVTVRARLAGALSGMLPAPLAATAVARIEAAPAAGAAPDGVGHWAGLSP
ncbi:TadE family type IV pilus minor pilin [Arthrobacter sp. 35W]|uniref:TadE family type IV pilus minor pilin n=1 Tax=Arthrobacter sp. 35W TaxID=1132441 RepID=UPI0005588AA6|nr:TadE family type IV pilus minor pilin [Arthrobacter sp. 35W]